jgi:hypothetical protein
MAKPSLFRSVLHVLSHPPACKFDDPKEELLDALKGLGKAHDNFTKEEHEELDRVIEEAKRATGKSAKALMPFAKAYLEKRYGVKFPQPASPPPPNEDVDMGDVE